MRTLTGMGGLGNAQELAELLRQMGRGPDSMLAHITPEEAQMLLESGGSGKINPQTGLPEFPARNTSMRRWLRRGFIMLRIAEHDFSFPYNLLIIHGMAPDTV
jgi:hypothetical protein